MVNTVREPEGIWYNSDGLRVKFGVAAADDAVVGAPWVQDEEQRLVVDLDWKRLPAFGANDAVGQIYGGYPNFCFDPTTTIITRLKLYTDVAWSTASSPTLTLGLVDQTGTIEIDNNGLLATVTAAQLNANDLTNVGALVTTQKATLNSVAYVEVGGTYQASAAPKTITGISSTAQTSAFLWASVGTANFTAGHSKLIINYITVDSDKGGLYGVNA